MNVRVMIDAIGAWSHPFATPPLRLGFPAGLTVSQTKPKPSSGTDQQWEPETWPPTSDTKAGWWNPVKKNPQWLLLQRLSVFESMRWWFFSFHPSCIFARASDLLLLLVVLMLRSHVEDSEVRNPRHALHAFICVFTLSQRNTQTTKRCALLICAHFTAYRTVRVCQMCFMHFACCLWIHLCLRVSVFEP